jgi:hypothetical protein
MLYCCRRERLEFRQQRINGLNQKSRPEIEGRLLILVSDFLY